MNLKKVRKIIATGALVLLLCAAGGLGLIRWSIQSSLDKWCSIAQASHPHPGDDVSSLMAYVQSDAHSWIERNHAVWALGQARDTRALPVLESHYTGEACDHDHRLCQHELYKAIKLCQGRTPNPLRIKTPTLASVGQE